MIALYSRSDGAFHAGSRKLSVAVGKHNGNLLAWTVENASLTSSQQVKDTLKKGRSFLIQQAHGWLALTSALLTQGPRSHERGLLGFVVSAGLDKNFKSWRPALDKARSEKCDIAL